MPSRRGLAHLAAALCAALPAFAIAQVKIGLVLSLTGPAASLGIPARDTVTLLPKQIGGQSVEYIVLDDASDTTQAVQDTKKLISENHVDAIIGSSITPNSLAMIDVVADGETPDDLAGLVGENHRARGCKTPLGIQDPADRRDDGIGDRRACRARTASKRSRSSARPTRLAKPSTPKSQSSRNCITSAWWRASASIAPIRA